MTTENKKSFLQELIANPHPVLRGLADVVTFGTCVSPLMLAMDNPLSGAMAVAEPVGFGFVSYNINRNIETNATALQQYRDISLTTAHMACAALAVVNKVVGSPSHDIIAPVCAGLLMMTETALGLTQSLNTNNTTVSPRFPQRDVS